MQEELVLRPAMPSDAEQIFALTSMPEVARFMRFDTHRELREAQELLEGYRGEHARGYLIEQNGELVGFLGMKQNQEQETDWVPSVFCAPQFWNRGYVTRMMKRLITIAREELHAQTLTGYVVGENMGSRRMLEKNGFAVVEVRHFDDCPSGLYIYRLALQKTGQPS